MLTQEAPYYELGAGVRFDFGTIVPPMGRVVAYVRSSDSNLLPADIRAKCFRTLNAALSKCTLHGDTVIVLPGHAENISTADQMSNLVAGTRIVGVGRGTGRPTFAFTAATASFLLDVANVTIENCIFDLCHTGNAGVTVAAPFTVSAAGCGFERCLMRMTSDANDRVGTAITTTTAADHFRFIGNKVLGFTVSSAVLDVTGVFMDLNGADYLVMRDNHIALASSAVAVGPVRFVTTASLGVEMVNNYIQNSLAASTGAVVGLAGCSGFVDRLYMQTLGSHTDFEVIGDANGAWSASGGSLAFGPDCYASGDLAQRMAALTPLNS